MYDRILLSLNISPCFPGIFVLLPASPCLFSPIPDIKNGRVGQAPRVRRYCRGTPAGYVAVSYWQLLGRTYPAYVAILVRDLGLESST